MSVAVRVSVWILGACVFISAAFAVMTYLQKQTLQGENQGLHNSISQYKSQLDSLNNQAKQLQDQAQQLNTKISQEQQDKAQLQGQYDDLKHKSDDLQSQIQQANSDRDDWKSRVDTLTHERDALVAKLKNQPVKIVYKDRLVKVPAVDDGSSAAMPAAPSGSGAQGDEYWAGVLRQKAALQVQLEKEKYDLDQAALQVADLKKQNSDLEIELKQVSNEKDEIVQKIKYGQDLADNLSIDLARSRNDQQAVNDRADKLKQENLQLMSQIRDLTSTKIQLEKSISNLTDQKDSMQKKLIETESVIQSRIDDIWKIKQSLDKKLSENGPNGPAAGGMELPPIIVNAPSNAQQPPVAQAPQSQAATATISGKTEGTIISINESNNFVIVDLGQQNSSVSIGTALRVYRGSDQIATLEVIQVRKDICAADIKDKSADLKVGDVVRFQ